MSYKATRYLTDVKEFIRHVFTKLDPTDGKWSRIRRSWQQLNADEQVELVNLVVGEYLLSSDMPQRQPQISVKWAGCYFRDFGDYKEATEFAEALARRDFNLPVLLTHSSVKAGWHGTVPPIGATEISVPVGELSIVPRSHRSF